MRKKIAAPPPCPMTVWGSVDTLRQWSKAGLLVENILLLLYEKRLANVPEDRVTVLWLYAYAGQPKDPPPRRRCPAS